MRHRYILSLAMILWAGFDLPALASDKPPGLTDTDKKELDQLIKDFLFDPTGAERVRVPVTVYSPWGGSRAVECTGWLVKGNDGAGARVYFADRWNVAVPPANQVKKVDFLEECRDRYLPKPNRGEKEDPFKALRRNASGTDPDLAMCAWLHKLGHNDLAAHALPSPGGKKANQPREKDTPTRLEVLKDELAWHAFAGLVHGYANRADEEALMHGERLFFLYKDLAEKKDGDLEQSAHIVRELKRRKEAGTFGKPAAKGPVAEFEKMDLKSQVAYLIGQLDEVDARQFGQPGGVNLAGDWRIVALIKIGEPAVAALIECLEADERLTRSVHFWRDFSRHRTVLSVREAALAAIMSILRVSVFESRSTGDNFTSRGDKGVKETVAKLRKYWDTYGKLPFDERMMKVLTDPNAGSEACWEAALNLSTFGAKRTIGTTFASDWWIGGRPEGPNPVVAKFSKPTVAEAMLAALDRSLERAQAKKAEYPYNDESRLEGFYLHCLADLGDRRIAATLAERVTKAKEIGPRKRYATAAFDLGEPKPFLALAADFEAGKLPLPNRAESSVGFPQLEGMQHDVSELVDSIKLFSQRKSAETDRALYALTDPKHPYYPTVVRVARGDSPYVREPRWYSHPFWLKLLRRGLDDTTLTGTTYRIEGDRLEYEKKRGGGSQGIPEELSDPKARFDRAEERACDKAAEVIARVILGAPDFHVLRRDREERLTTMKSLLDRFDGKFRLATKEERDELRASPFDSLFLPDIRSLAHTATAEDVGAGRAIFELGGKGKLADEKLPAWLLLKADAGKERKPRGLVVQAEVGRDGNVTYGVIFRHAIRTVPAVEIESIEPMAAHPK